MEILLLALIVGAVVCGMVLFSRLQDITQRLSRLELELGRLLLRQSEEEWPRAATGHEEPNESIEAEGPVEPEPAATADDLSPPEIQAAPQPQYFGRAEPAAARPPQPASALREQWSAFEVTLGTQWLNWAGILLVTIGVLFFLKFAYDNQWIGPRGRIAIGVVLGAAALVAGDKARRGGYPILFHTLTGGGLAVFYGCIYFSFQVYQLSGQTLSFFMLIVVTALALALAIAHNAPLICLFGQLGGFLSPILISTGQNRPVELFAFVAILNLATMGCAYFKNWRNVNVVAFAGTWILYAGWAERFYSDSQLGIAIFFSSLFFLMFLVVPTLGAAARREPLAAQDLWLIAVNTVLEFGNNYILLYAAHRSWLGPAVILQALTLSAMYAYWARRCAEDSKTRVALLFGALALVTVAVPIQLRFYGIPIGWALEALLLGYIGVQYRHWVFQATSVAAIILAALGLLVRLPLHTQLFTPVLNRPFGSWATVIAMSFALYALFRKYGDKLDESLKKAPAAPLALAVVLLCALAHLEVSAFWTVRREFWQPAIAQSYRYTSLIFLWSAIPLIVLWLGRKRAVGSSIPAALAGYAVGLLVILEGLATGAWTVWNIPFFNLQWLSRASYAVALWTGASWMGPVSDRPAKWPRRPESLAAVEGVGHVILVFLIYAEVNTWISASDVFSSFMRFGFVSALWSLQALILIGVGLGTRNQFRRIFGFILFGVTVVKLLLIDMAILQPVYRILSFAVTGVLLIVAAFLYQKFAKSLLEPNRELRRTAKGEVS